MGNQFVGPASGMNPWMQNMQEMINNNPAGNIAALQGMTPQAVGAQGVGQTGQFMGYAAGGPQMNQYTPTAQYANTPEAWSAINSVQGYGGPGSGGRFMGAAPGMQALDPNAAVGAAQNLMNRIIAPQIAQNAVAGGQGAMSGAMLEALANASAQTALPLTQQAMQNQMAWNTPQMQAVLQGGLASQGAQNQLLGQSYGAQLQGALAQQGAQNQFLGAQQQGGIQGGLNQQNAQNQILGQGFGQLMQGGLNQQNAMNQMLGQQQQAGLQGLLNQGQNQFNYGMSIPGQQAQMLSNIQGRGQAQMGLQGLDQQAQQQVLANQQEQWNRALAAISGTAYMNPGQNTYTKNPSPGFMDYAKLAIGGAAAAAPFVAMCWIADALYGEDSEDANAARTWVGEGWQGDEAEFFREWYFRHGIDVAHALKHDEEFRSSHEEDYRALFDGFVEKGKAYIANAA
jgi:hypothetical protein